MCRGCARTIVRRIRISLCDGASARCNASNRPDQPSASSPLTPPSTTLSISSAISHPAPRSESSETKRSRRGGLRPQPESQLKLATFTPPIRVPVTAPPNLFTTAAPLAPSAALCNMTTCLQQQAEWIGRCIRYMRGHKLKVCKPTKEMEDQWIEHHEQTDAPTLVVKTNSWYMGSKVEGKPRRLLSYIGGVGAYRQKCDAVAANGYAGFAMQ